MLYALLAYHEEHLVQSWSDDQDLSLMGRMGAVHDRLTDAGHLGPAARLGATARAVTVRGGLVVDGPFAETKEQLLGFYVVDGTQEDAIQAAKDLQAVNPTAAYEVRPIVIFRPGMSIAHTDAGLADVRP